MKESIGLAGAAGARPVHAGSAPHRERVLAIVLFGGFLFAPLLLPALRGVLLTAACVALVTIGVVLLLRAGQVSFGHGLYFATGAYAAAALMRTGTAELLLVLPLAACAAAVLGAVLGGVLVRYRDIFFAMLNLAFSMVGYVLLLKLYAWTGGSDGVTLAQPTVAGLRLGASQFGWTLYVVAVGVLALVCLGAAAWLRAPAGQALGAIKTNETRLEYLGVSARAVLYAAYVGSAALAGLGGALMAFATGHVTPALAYWTKSAEFVFVAVLGGVGSVLGAVLGAVGFELIRTYASAAAANAWQLVMGAVLVLVVLFAPNGLWGMVRRRTPQGRQA